MHSQTECAEVEAHHEEEPKMQRGERLRKNLSWAQRLFQVNSALRGSGLVLLVVSFWVFACAPAFAAERVRLILDWFPNADHVPLYVARDGGHFAREGLDVVLIAPADPNDPLKLTAAARAEFAVNYQPQVIIARSRGLPVRAIGVLVAHPLSSLAFLKRSGIRTPADLRGKRIGYSVHELELALLRGVTAHHGLASNEYETVNVNFNLVSALLSGQVDAVIGAFWNYELAELELEGVEGDYFDLSEHGIPSYDELVIITHDQLLKTRRDTALRLVRALDAALQFTHKNPQQALALYLKANPQVRKALDRRAFELVLPHFARSQRFSAHKWENFSAFAMRQGLIEQRPENAELYTNLLP